MAVSSTRSAHRDSPVWSPSPLRGWLVGIGVLLASAASAQTSTEDRAYVGFSLARGTAIGSDGGKLDNRPLLDLRLPLPPVFLGKSILVPSLGYETRWLGLEARGAGATIPEEERSRNFHRIQLGLSLIRPVNPRWMLIFGVTGSTRTDFRGPFDVGMDTSWVGFAMANYLIGGDPGQRLTFGLVGLMPFDRIPVFPMVAYAYRKGPYIVEVGVPRMTLMRKFGEGFEVGLTGMFEQQVFHTRFGDSRLSSLGAHYIRETSLRFAPTANFRLGGGSLWLSTAVGVDFLNDYALLDERRKKMELGGIPTQPAPYMRVSLIFRPPRRAAAQKAAATDSAGTTTPPVRISEPIGAGNPPR